MLECGSQAGAGLVSVRAAVPFNLERPTALHRRPRVIGNYGDAAGAVNIFGDSFDLEYVFNAWNSFCCSRVETPHLAAKSWATSNDCVQHSGNFCIEAKFRGAIRLRGNFNSWNRTADDLEVLRILELDIVLCRPGQL